MDNSKEFQLMLNKAIISEPFAFVDFDRTKNVQDQLQEMIGDTPVYNIKNSMFSVLDDFRNFAFATAFKESIPLTMEQLWLAFVMKEKYGKIWNGKEWE